MSTQPALDTAVDRLKNDPEFRAVDSEHTDLETVPAPADVIVSFRNGNTRSPPPEFLFGRAIVRMAMVDPDAEVIPNDA